MTPPQPQPAKVLANLCHAEAEVIHSLSSPTMAKTVTPGRSLRGFHVSHQSQSNQFQYPMLSNSLFDENGNLDLHTKDEGTLDFPGKSPENRNLSRNAMGYVNLCPIAEKRLGHQLYSWNPRPCSLAFQGLSLWTMVLGGLRLSLQAS